jgi:uncharacterized membrane protein YfcA
MIQNHFHNTIIIASICGLIAGLLGSPGFALIIPLLFIFNITRDFRAALGIFFIGTAIPFIIMSIAYGLKHNEHIDYEKSILFSIVFATMAYISMYHLKNIIDEHYKLFISGVFLCITGLWFLHYYFTKKTI